MSTPNNTAKRKPPSSHDLLWWLLLIPLLAANLLAGGVIVVTKPELFGAVFAIGAFSLAYALHILSVSSTLCSVQIRMTAAEESKFLKLRALEYRVVTYGMSALGGGLAIVLAAALCAFHTSLAGWVFAAGGLLELVGVLGYVFLERRWPDKARAILNEY